MPFGIVVDTTETIEDQSNKTLLQAKALLAVKVLQTK